MTGTSAIDKIVPRIISTFSSSKLVPNSSKFRKFQLVPRLKPMAKSLSKSKESSALAGVKSANSLGSLATSPGGQLANSSNSSLAQSSAGAVYQKAPLQQVSHEGLDIGELDPSNCDPLALIEDGSKKQTDADRSIFSMKAEQTINYLNSEIDKNRVKKAEFKRRRTEVEANTEGVKLVGAIADNVHERNRTNYKIHRTNEYASIYEDKAAMVSNVAQNIRKMRETSDARTQMNLGGTGNNSRVNNDLSYED